MADCHIRVDARENRMQEPEAEGTTRLSHPGLHQAVEIGRMMVGEDA